MNDIENLRKQLQERLMSLRDVVSGFRDDTKYVALFDEFVREQEFDLALHAVCDFLLEPKSAAVDMAVLQQIQNLHGLMNLEDNCVKQLQHKIDDRG